MCWTHAFEYEILKDTPSPPPAPSRDNLKHNFQQDSSQLKKSIACAFIEPECKNCTCLTTELQTLLRRSDDHLHLNSAWCSTELNLQ